MLNITNTSSFVLAFLAEGDNGGIAVVGLVTHHHPGYAFALVLVEVFHPPQEHRQPIYPPAPAVKAPEAVVP